MKHIRTKVLGVLCLALFVGVIAAAPAGAAEAAKESSGGEARAKSDCPFGYICFWSGKTFGTAECQAGQNCFSAFAGNQLGWHNLESINPQSMYNNTANRLAWFPTGPFGQGYGIGAGQTNQWGSPYGGGFEQL